LQRRQDERVGQNFSDLHVEPQDISGSISP
jgi:hypothetical protein